MKQTVCDFFGFLVINVCIHVLADNENKNDLQENPPLRALKVGDIFTAQEVFPIAQKLMALVPKEFILGEGKGIVSSSKSPEILSDKLFTQLFMTYNRMVKLKADDLLYLDLLQALALSGHVFEKSGKFYEDMFASYLNAWSDYPKKETQSECQIVLIGKVATDTRKRTLKIAQKLAKKRKLKVGRKSISISETNETTSPGSISTLQTESETGHMKVMEAVSIPKPAPTKPGLHEHEPTTALTESPNEIGNLCRWEYDCSNTANTIKCGPKMVCDLTNKTVNNMDIPIKHDENEHTAGFKEFRKAIGVCIVDEEVAKILFHRYSLIEDGDTKPFSESESLNDYFSRVMAKISSTKTNYDKLYTKPMSNNIDVTTPSTIASTPPLDQNTTSTSRIVINFANATTKGAQIRIHVQKNSS
ncbi:uncharacterized protein LOC113231588 [Hyposmocoma kahamanoa]|uniref:uncharacterized protein LOC113231588 n=1 Tax=Hyposmocoma kahamanoa TaxID=1477025 RepID=UPI000E6D884E|nr:uncharacterized protein LOC113231588 [Hyposmocoma kahamanoa]